MFLNKVKCVFNTQDDYAKFIKSLHDANSRGALNPVRKSINLENYEVTLEYFDYIGRANKDLDALLKNCNGKKLEQPVQLGM